MHCCAINSHRRHLHKRFAMGTRVALTHGSMHHQSVTYPFKFKQTAQLANASRGSQKPETGQQSRLPEMHTGPGCPGGGNTQAGTFHTGWCIHAAHQLQLTDSQPESREWINVHLSHGVRQEHCPPLYVRKLKTKLFSKKIKFWLPKNMQNGFREPARARVGIVIE